MSAIFIGFFNIQYTIVDWEVEAKYIYFFLETVCVQL